MEFVYSWRGYTGHEHLMQFGLINMIFDGQYLFYSRTKCNRRNAIAGRVSDG
jgi:hypothetical protein